MNYPCGQKPKRDAEGRSLLEPMLVFGCDVEFIKRILLGVEKCYQH